MFNGSFHYARIALEGEGVRCLEALDPTKPNRVPVDGHSR